jgi:hypothetical protein
VTSVEARLGCSLITVRGNSSESGVVVMYFQAGQPHRLAEEPLVMPFIVDVVLIAVVFGLGRGSRKRITNNLAYFDLAYFDLARFEGLAGYLCCIMLAPVTAEFM